MQDKLRNVKMAESNKTNLAHFLVTTTLYLLVLIDTAVVEPQN